MLPALPNDPTSSDPHDTLRQLPRLSEFPAPAEAGEPAPESDLAWEAELRCPADGLFLRNEGRGALRCERGHRYACTEEGIVELAPGVDAPGFGALRAATYDLTFDLLNVRGLFGATPKRLIEMHRTAARAAASEKGVLADIGCGTARWALPELVGARVRRYLGIDPSLAMLRLAAKRAARSSKRDAVVLIHSEAEHLPLGNATCDAALSSLGMQFVPDHAAALLELRRVLRPSGHLYVAAPALGLRDRYDRRHEEREVKDFPLDVDTWPAQLVAAGFEVATIETMGALVFTHAIAA